LITVAEDGDEEKEHNHVNQLAAEDLAEITQKPAHVWVEAKDFEAWGSSKLDGRHLPDQFGICRGMAIMSKMH
jgi:hypothetical protein